GPKGSAERIWEDTPARGGGGITGMDDRDLPVVALQVPDVVKQLQGAPWIVDADDHIDRTFDCLGYDGLASLKKTGSQEGGNDDRKINPKPALQISGHAGVAPVLAPTPPGSSSG